MNDTSLCEFVRNMFQPTTNKEAWVVEVWININMWELGLPLSSVCLDGHNE